MPASRMPRDPRRIAQSFELAAECTRRRKAGPFQSANSMLSFYITRADRNLPVTRERVLDRDKLELRRLCNRT